MKFQVPQFIEVEDKIFGPFTLKQFIYLAGAAGFFAMLYTLLPFSLALFITIPVATLGVGLAFYKINDRPLIRVLEAMFYYFLSNKLYLWRKEQKHIIQKAEVAKGKLPYVPKLSANKLKELAWSLDIKESMYTERSKPK